MNDTIQISVVIPALNEQPNLAPLKNALIESLEPIDRCFEVIFVDDGSTDGTYDEISGFARKDERFRGVRLKGRMGKAVALGAGFSVAHGEILIALDGDNQDDPREIPAFLEKIEEGYDLVTGWKKVRRDTGFRVLASNRFNGVVRWISGLPLHDFNCGFKAMRREVVDSLPLHGGWHRFIPVFANLAGFRVGEIAVEHRARMFGRSKYGFGRYLRGLVDCLRLFAIVRLSVAAPTSGPNITENEIAERVGFN